MPEAAARRAVDRPLREERILLRPSTTQAACVGVVEEGGLLKGAGSISGQRTNAGAPPPDVEIQRRPWRLNSEESNPRRRRGNLPMVERRRL